MTELETIDIIDLISAAYPNFKPQNIEKTIKIWHLSLADIPYEAVEMGLAMYIRTNHSGFAPVVGDILNQIQTVKECASNTITGMEAWGIVRKAMLNATYKAKEEFEKLPEILQRAVGSPSQLRAWATDPSFSEGVAQSNFLKTYSALEKKQTEMAKMPENIKMLIGGMKNDNGRIGDSEQLQICEESGRPN